MLKRLRLMGTSLFRLVLLACVALAVCGLVGPEWGVGLMIVGLVGEILMHLNYIARLAQWLENPRLDNAPSARSILWSEIFYRLMKNRKALDKNAERLAQREDRNRRILAALPEGIILTKKDWTLNWCNGNAAQLFGIGGEEDFGRHLFAFVHDANLLAWFKARVFDGAYLWEPDASGRLLRVSVIAVDKKNILVLTRDATEQERLDAMRRDFVANVSHELRTPLTVLRGFLDMAVDAAEPGAQKTLLQAHHIALMREQARRMEHLLSDLLILSRLETGSANKPKEPFSLSEMLAAVTSEISVMAKGTHTVNCRTAPIVINAYPDEVRSAVANLMTNAVRYTPAGGKVEASCSLNPDGTVVVTVRDNGIGIAPEHIPRLTERFYRVDKSRSRDTGGTGLGLAIVKHVVLHHNARLTIESEVGKGSVFSIIFPSSSRVDSADQPAA
ncbi:MAG: phosphate regulon sensor histidine kinase PhoR [Duodenibacillus sp.]